MGISVLYRELLSDFWLWSTLIISQLWFGFHFYEFLHVLLYSVVSDFLMMQIVRLLLCIVGLFAHRHKTQNRIQSRCDVDLYVCKYNGPTVNSILFIYVKSHRVTFCEKASFRQLALILLSGDDALNPEPMKFGFANCRSIRNKGATLCEEVKTGNFDVSILRL